jgi:hypothetical protein
MANAVVVTVSSKVVGSGFVVPYNHHEGLQLHRPAPGRPVQPVLYQVPIYEVRVEDAGTYKAVRFALRNTGRTPSTRACDAGLSHERSCTPAWLPYYSPHSFSGTGRQGAWRLIAGQGFLIHEGADSRRREVGGSLGCIEIVDGGWNSFLADIERRAGASCNQIGQLRALTVKIQAASYPFAKLVS